ncbi:HNH endonuclease [Bdellovibrio bacteriovorus]|uniref:HNH endonuclease n=1 Tax=Bdellovibrio bacteriovorus TaxID=959 RepID=UPI0035A5F9F4
MNPLAKFTNDEIESRLKILVAKERELLHVILEHIKEVDSRKLYLERAYSSLYDYMTKELQYSGSAAMRRIEAARLLRQVPVIAEKIQEGSLNLTQIGELSRAVKAKEKSTGEKISALHKRELLEKISSKTTHETQKELSLALDLQIKEFDSKRVQKDESVRLEITLSKEQFEMLTRCRDLASHSLSQNHLSTSWADVLEIVMDKYLRSKTDSQQTKNFSTTAAVTARANKTLTLKTRREVLKRDKCCQYKDPKSGKVCGSTYALQTDHKVSRWANGDHSCENLQMLCAAHNNWKYRKECGIKLTK